MGLRTVRVYWKMTALSVLRLNASQTLSMRSSFCVEVCSLYRCLEKSVTSFAFCLAAVQRLNFATAAFRSEED